MSNMLTVELACSTSTSASGQGTAAIFNHLQNSQTSFAADLIAPDIHAPRFISFAEILALSVLADQRHFV